MEVRCIKDFMYPIGNGDYKKIIIGDFFQTYSNGFTETIEDDKGNYIITLDDEQFDKYFEIVTTDEFVDEKETVNHPEHYQGELETIDIIEYVLSDINSKYAFALGNVIKYCNRANKKGKQEDLDKAKWYIEHLFSDNNV